MGYGKTKSCALDVAVLLQVKSLETFKQLVQVIFLYADAAVGYLNSQSDAVCFADSGYAELYIALFCVFYRIVQQIYNYLTVSDLVTV